MLHILIIAGISQLAHNVEAQLEILATLENSQEKASKSILERIELNAELKGGMTKIVNLNDLQAVLFQRLVMTNYRSEAITCGEK